jgi:hypothetical protein
MTAVAGNYASVTKTVYVTAGQITTTNFQLYQLAGGSDDNPAVIYVVISVIVVCSVLIFSVEVLYYRRSKQRMIAYLQNYDEQLDEDQNAFVLH